MADQVKYANKLKDAKVLVIGGSSGIGYAVAESLIENNCEVTISASNSVKAEQTVVRLVKAYPSAKARIHGQFCDLGDEMSLESNISALLEKVGKLDHIVYTAGDKVPQIKLENLNMARIKQAGMVRFFSPLLLAKHAAKYLSAGPKSSITLTGSGLSDRPRPDSSNIDSYATDLQGMARQLALDMKPIRVNLVSPGAVDTELWGSFGLSGEVRTKLLETLAARLPTEKVPGPEELAESYIYLIRDRNITGAMINTSGSFLLV